MNIEDIAKPLISIIVPVYNTEKYLDKCVQSLVNQTFKNIEIFLIDDGSTDSSPQICDEWMRKDKRIYVKHIANQGVSYARNVGIELANGEYIGFVDSDDWVELDTYECLLRELLEKDVEASGGGYIQEDDLGEIVSLKKEPPRVFPREMILREIFTLETPKILYWELCDKLFKANVIKNTRFNVSIGTSEDKLFFWQIMKNVENFSYIPLFKYHYRMRNESATHNKISVKSFSELMANYLILKSASQESDILKQTVLFNYLVCLLSCTRRMLVYDSKKYKELIVKNQMEIRKNLYKYFKIPNFSCRLLRAIIFLSLPFSICSRLIFLIKKPND